MNDNTLFQKTRIHDLALRNRMVMAPMTRNRAAADGVPTAMMTTYYAQRASAGMIITEATQISEQANGYRNTPGIYTDAQAAGWRQVIDRVHQEQGLVVSQIWHAGRVSHTSLQPNGAAPVAPSSINAETMVFTEKGFEKTSDPRELSIDEIPVVVGQFAHAARVAGKAGFDGVEIHGANGYLIEQFLKDGSNKRTDAYGGTIPSRIRFALEVVTAVIESLGTGKVGLRISPRGVFNGMTDSDPHALFGALAEALNDYPLAYLHVIEPLPGHPAFATQAGVEPVAPLIRKIYQGTLILNGGYGQVSAEQALKNNEADLIAFGVPFLANPDLPKRYQLNADLNAPDQKTFYGGDEKGYTDYPFLVY